MSDYELPEEEEEEEEKGEEGRADESNSSSYATIYDNWSVPGQDTYGYEARSEGVNVDQQTLPNQSNSAPSGPMDSSVTNEARLRFGE